ncbi:MAG: hypothetical protein WKF83_13715 [Nocardioidaceae bacterium]
MQTGAAASVAEHPDRHLDRPAVPRHRQHRQPPDERDQHEPGDGSARGRVRLHPRATCGGSPSTR